MNEFTPEQAARWDGWRHVGALRARRGDGVARVIGLLVLAATLTALVVEVWR